MRLGLAILVLVCGCAPSFQLEDESAPPVMVLRIERGWFIPAGGEVLLLTPDPKTRLEQWDDVALPLKDVVVMDWSDYMDLVRRAR